VSGQLQEFDAVIVGAGPAGLFAALEITRTKPGARVCIVERGKSLSERKEQERLGQRPRDWLSGFGGAGFFIGGRLSLDMESLACRPANVSRHEATEIAGYVGGLLRAWGVGGRMLDSPPPALAKIAARAATFGLTWRLNYPARHLSPEERMTSLDHLRDELHRAGAMMADGAHVDEIVPGKTGWTVTAHKGASILRLTATCLLLAPGRQGAEWLANVVRGLGGSAIEAPSIGVRLEAASQALAPLTNLTPDPRLSAPIDSSEFRTYAFVTGGSVTVAGTPGHARITVRPGGSRPTGQTSFAVLRTLPEEAGGGHGVQRFPTPAHARLDQVLPIGAAVSPPDASVPTADIPAGSVQSHWPEQYWQGLDEFLGRMENLAPGIRSPATLVYSPSVENQWAYALDASGETEVAGLYLAGDGGAISQGAMAAAISGVVAGRKIGSRL